MLKTVFIINRFTLLVTIIVLISCKEVDSIPDQHHDNFEDRTINPIKLHFLEKGISHLSIKSQLHSISEHKAHNFTVTANIRNINLKDTVYITKAEYLDTHAQLLHSYFEQPIYIAPLETLEIVIDEVYQNKQTGASFIFHWKKKITAKETQFQGIMISTYGNRGLSFTTQGQRID